MNPYLLHMPHWPKDERPEPAGTPSERIRALLARMGHPEKKLPPVVHVGGTKGKGSTIALLRAMLEAAGYRVHAYTSPHIARFNERIVLAGSEIDDALLHLVLEEVRLAAGDTPLGFFDATTAAAILAFGRVKGDILLMEMGLGGTVDATNFLDTPLLTVLTTVSFDHTEYMGETLASIASFESGIFKKGVPCIVSWQHEDVWPTLRERAAAAGAPLYEYGRHWQARRRGEFMVFADAHGEAALPLPALPGAHQIVNAGNAIAAVSALLDFEVAPQHIMEGLRRAVWKGRLSKLPLSGLPEGSELWFDGGHNLAAAQAISLHAREEWADKPLYLIFGATQGKDPAGMLACFASVAAGIYSVKVRSEPKSYAPETIAELAKDVAQVQQAGSIRDALDAITAQESRPFRALVFGSLYLWLEANSPGA